MDLLLHLDITESYLCDNGVYGKSPTSICKVTCTSRRRFLLSKDCNAGIACARSSMALPSALMVAIFEGETDGADVGAAVTSITGTMSGKVNATS